MTAGEDITPHLSERVETAFIPERQRPGLHPRRRDADRDRMLNAWGIHHLHLSSAAFDIRDPDAVARLFDAAGELDGLVNNAAGNFVCPSLELSPNGFRAVVESSLHGSFFCSQALARQAIARGGGAAILNIVATYAWTGAPGVAHSAAAKAGLVALTKTLAREWGPHGVRVNALAPGFVATESARANILSDPLAEERMRSLIPLDRFAEGDEASYCTGAMLTVDGGRSLGVAMHGVTARV